MRSSMLVRLPHRLVAMPTASNSVGKKARNKLNAMAWEIMPQRGKTRAKIRMLRLERAAAESISKQYKQSWVQTGSSGGGASCRATGPIVNSIEAKAFSAFPDTER